RRRCAPGRRAEEARDKAERGDDAGRDGGLRRRAIRPSAATMRAATASIHYLPASNVTAASHLWLQLSTRLAVSA
ncbi:hypothetical protein, partial [Mycobacterium tuberculosis]|uniref:hypothetical protein n=2 Tax=Mycobacterium tuberculosis TaxID=1773 RepID=UPI001BE11555